MEQRFAAYHRNLGSRPDKVALASSKVSEASSIMKANVSQMAKKVEDVEARLLPVSQEIKAVSKKNEENAKELA